MPIFWSIDLEQMLIYQKIVFMKNCYAPFDAEVAKKILNVI